MTKLILIGHKRDKPILGLRRTLLIFNLKLCAKINLVMVGCLFINIQDTYYDYSEYLGPDWKKEKVSYSNPGSTVVNHQSWIDILVNMYR